MNNLLMGRRMFVSLACAVSTLVATESFAAVSGPRMSISAKVKVDEERLPKVETEKGNMITTVEAEKASCMLTLDVMNRGKESGSCQLEWYFLGETISPNKDPERGIVSSGKKEISLEAGAKVSETITENFELITTTRENTSGDGDSSPTPKTSGTTYVAYIALATRDGEIIAKKSNSSRWLKEEWIEQCQNFKPKGAAKGKGKKK